MESCHARQTNSTKVAQVETDSEATHEKDRWDHMPSFLLCAGDAGLRDAKLGRALLRIWLSVGCAIDPAECDECGKWGGGGVKSGERESAGREAARIYSVFQEFAAITSHGSGTGRDGARACGDVERELDASSRQC
jgi:hypothetical protein